MDKNCIICRSNSYGFKVEHTTKLEMICLKCGTPYIKKFRGKQSINIKKELIPHIKNYWNDKKIYMGLATKSIRESHKGSDTGKKEFVEWLNKTGVLLEEL